MSQLSDALRSGHFAQSEISSRSRLISWSHRGRFATAMRLAEDVRGARILDYGCGDGTFLGLLMDGEWAPPVAVGAELFASTVTDCRERFAAHKGLQFVLIEDLDRAAHRGSYDVVYCMEVLEHVIDPVPLLEAFHRLLVPGGNLVMHVPL